MGSCGDRAGGVWGVGGGAAWAPAVGDHSRPLLYLGVREDQAASPEAWGGTLTRGWGGGGGTLTRVGGGGGSCPRFTTPRPCSLSASGECF